MNAEREAQASVIAGLCFLACIAMVVMLGVMQAFRAYAPGVREFLLWIVEAPTFGVTVFLTAIASSLLTCLCAMAIGRVRP